MAFDMAPAANYTFRKAAPGRAKDRGRNAEPAFRRDGRSRAKQRTSPRSLCGVFVRLWRFDVFAKTRGHVSQPVLALCCYKARGRILHAMLLAGVWVGNSLAAVL